MALVAADGSLLGTARGPRAMQRGKGRVEAWLDELAGLIETEPAGRPGRPGGPVAGHISACVANADLPEEVDRLAAALRARGGA